MNSPKKPLEEDLRSLRINRPQTTQPSKGPLRKALNFAVVLTLGLTLGILLSPYFQGLFNTNIGVQEVSVVLATLQDYDRSQPIFSAGGYVVARYQVEVGSKITGRVVALEIKEGDSVRKGQVIARLEDSELRAQVSQAEANLAAAEARLLEVETGSRPQEIKRAKAEVHRTEADLKNSKLILDRTARLIRTKVVEDQALDDAQARHDMALAANHAAVENYELVRIGPRNESIQLTRAQLQQVKAELSFVNAQYQNTIIRAPVSGMILDRYVDLGEMVTTGFTSERGAKQALVSIADLMDLQIELDISETDIARVNLNQPTVIRPDAYQDRRYPGTVEYIASVADRQKATIQVKVQVLEPDNYLRPDMGAKVTFYQKGSSLPDLPTLVLVPQQAVVSLAGNRVVYLARDAKVVIQQVDTGKEQGDLVEIVFGLEGGETVITGGHETLKAGDRIIVR